MKLFRYICLLSLSIVLFTACDDEVKKEEVKNKTCAECYMPINKNRQFTASLKKNGSVAEFDDIGCMILYAHDKKIHLKLAEPKTYSKDTKKYINPFEGHFQIDEKTPMMYGFSVYENKTDKKMIDFNEVTIKMLRGEHMRNLKIRKQLLGY